MHKFFKLWNCLLLTLILGGNCYAAPSQFTGSSKALSGALIPYATIKGSGIPIARRATLDFMVSARLRFCPDDLPIDAEEDQSDQEEDSTESARHSHAGYQPVILGKVRAEFSPEKHVAPELPSQIALARRSSSTDEHVLCL